MSAPFKIIQEEDHVPGRQLFAVAVTALLVGAVAVGASAWLGAPSANTPPAPTFALPLEHELFDRPGRAQALGKAQAERLNGYGWVDRNAGLARIPIEQALQLSREQSR